MRYWLVKSEPSEFSIDDFAAAPGQTTRWTGVRNYQARNFMRDQMSVGDPVLFYHSSCAEPGIAGIAEVASGAYPDPSQFERDGPYFDSKATPETPRWFNVDIKRVRKTAFLPLKALRAYPELAALRILQRGNRLSITPVDPRDWIFIVQRLGG